jgi:hypothetical protein
MRHDRFDRLKSRQVGVTWTQKDKIFEIAHAGEHHAEKPWVLTPKKTHQTLMMYFAAILQ